jgi:hypothetical protein
MPPRPFIALVILAWLATTSCLLYREVWPYLQPGGAPPYVIDLTEEIGGSLVNWTVLQKTAKIGSAVSRVERQPDATYRLQTTLTFYKFPILDLKKLVTSYHITDDGSLLGLSALCVIQLPHAPVKDPPLELQLDGALEGDDFVPRLSINKTPLPVGDVRVRMGERGNILNPMQLVNRVPGLRDGRTWRMALFDPVRALGQAFPEYKEVLASAEGMSVPELHAVVVRETLDWPDADNAVACYKIEYRKPGEPDPVAATWVRQSDGLVLQQHSRTALMEMTLRRDVPR